MPRSSSRRDKTDRRRTRDRLRLSLRQSATSPRETARRTGAPTRSSATARLPFDTRLRRCASSIRACAGSLRAPDAHPKFPDRSQCDRRADAFACSSKARPGSLRMIRERNASAGHRRMRGGEIGIEIERALVIRNRGLHSFEAAAIPVIAPLEICLIRLGAAWRCPAQHVDLIGHQLHRQRSRDVRSDVRLQVQRLRRPIGRRSRPRDALPCAFR